MPEEWSTGELGRQVQHLKNDKQDKESYLEWKRTIDSWKHEHDERHSWLVRSIGVIGLAVLIELLVKLIPLASGGG